MPLAQNYKDDVSLLESETALTKTTMECIDTRQETNLKTNVSEYFYSNNSYFPNCSMTLMFLNFSSILFDRSTHLYYYYDMGVSF